ncbi:MAG: lamin tail domain-containing protein [Proteobacteria bacterium]|nr:lamin tail domain-containing protein [Pseudomonadota bacterium]
MTEGMMKPNFLYWHWITTACALLLFGCANDDTDEPTGDAHIEPGEVVITELMPNIQSSATDWIELYNTTETAIDLQGCTLSDNGSDRFTINRTLEIEPGKYAVLASASDRGVDTPPALIDPAWVFSDDQFQLEAAGPDQVVLTCGGVAIDRVEYAEYSPGPATGTRGWQLDPNAIDSLLNDDESNWCYTPLPVLSTEYVYHTDSVASPGVDNPACNVLPFVYFDQKDVVLEGIDLVATLQIAELELATENATSMLTIWAIRDQIVTPEVAQRINDLYLLHIDAIYKADVTDGYDWNFGVWHFAWAISNLFRNGQDEVKTRLQDAYNHALERPDTLERFRLVAIDHVRGNRIIMGDIHELGRGFAQAHIVVPGNPAYLQSFDDYLNRQKPDLVD